MFALFSFAGWIFETVFCTISDGYYQNRGFLFGPVCPIYGVGAMVVYIMADCAAMYGVGADLKGWQLFLIGYVASAILEYSVHWLLEKKFHATWWDYTNMPLNLNGRICVPASTLFGLSYVAIFKYVYPWSQRVKAQLPLTVMEMAAYIFVIGFAVDTALTISTLKNFEHELTSMDEVVNTNMKSLLKVLKERRANDSDNDDEDTEQFKEGKAKLLIDLAKQRVEGMSAFAADTLSRVRNFKYPKLPKIRLDAILEELKKRRPFKK